MAEQPNWQNACSEYGYYYVWFPDGTIKVGFYSQSSCGMAIDGFHADFNSTLKNCRFLHCKDWMPPPPKIPEYERPDAAWHKFPSGEGPH